MGDVGGDLRRNKPVLEPSAKLADALGNDADSAIEQSNLMQHDCCDGSGSLCAVRTLGDRSSLPPRDLERNDMARALPTT